MHTNAICVSNDGNFICKHCTPEHMRKSAKELLDRLSSQGQAGFAYASTLARGKCREFNEAIDIERYRRGWVNRFWFDMIGCPKFIYEALKDEPGLPEKTAAALRRYEELHPETVKTAAIEENDVHGGLGVFSRDDKIWVSSRDVAEKFEKPHDKVLRSIRTLDCSPEFTAANFGVSEYKDPTGRTLPQYLMTRDGFTFLAMGFTGPKAAHFKELYIAEFNRMEEELYRRRFGGAAQKAEPVRIENDCPLPRASVMKAALTLLNIPALIEKENWDLIDTQTPFGCEVRRMARRASWMRENDADVGFGSLMEMADNGDSKEAQKSVLKKYRRYGSSRRPLEPATFLPALPPSSLQDDYDELMRKYEIERKKAATSAGNLRASRSNEEKLRHQLNKALDVIAKMAAK